MFCGVVLGTVVVASSFAWPVAWIGMELNLMAFIPYALSSLNTKKGAMAYFVCQSCGSLLVLVGGMLSDQGLLSLTMLLSGLVLKMGLLPLHFWVPLVVVHLSRPHLYLLITWQKLGPLVLLLSVSFGLSLLSGLNAMFGAMSMCSITSLPVLLIFSGMVQMGWVLVTSGWFSFYFLAIYFVVLGAVVLFSRSASVQFGWALLNAGGLPPFSGFIIKLKAILNIKNILVLLLVGSSGLALCSYVRLCLNSRMKAEPVSGALVASCGVGMV
uniref:NADH-ubiquinone oxidoreductase chain 2 n=1 Tax=Parasagitta elegans TaxID=1562708 RepID=A0A141CLK1_9BILA|nr:NADH dehydrogenase subunit 2 [Parasagitta elegans]